MLDFLANNYIWFFVAAGLLVLALIGFIVESKKKVKKDLKGKEVESKGEVIKEEGAQNETIQEEVISSKEEPVVNDIPQMEDNIKIPNPEESTLKDVPDEIETTPAFELNNYSDSSVKEEEKNTIGEIIPDDPVIPTAPESFYTEQNEEKKDNSEISFNSTENKQN